MKEANIDQSFNSSQKKDLGRLIKVDMEKMKFILGNDTDFFLEIFDIIISQIPDVIKDLYTSTAESQHEKVAATAHRFKSTINVLGNEYLTELTINIEKMGRTHTDITSLTHAISELDEACDELITHLQDLIQIIKQ